MASQKHERILWVSECCLAPTETTAPRHPGTIESGPNDPVIVCVACGNKADEMGVTFFELCRMKHARRRQGVPV